MNWMLLKCTSPQLIKDLIKSSYNSMPRVSWLNVPKGVPTPLDPISLSQGQASKLPDSHSFLNQLANQTDISQLLQTNYNQHQAKLIHHDLDNSDIPDALINQLLTANPMAIFTHNTRIISDTTKYEQLLATLSLHKIDICGVTETGHQIGQKYKFQQHLEYKAFWSSSIN